MALGNQLPDSNTVGLYRLDGGNLDSGGNGRTLSSVNVSFVGGKIGSGSANYNGAAYSDNSDSAFNHTGNFTVSCLFNAASKTNGAAIVTNVVTDANNYGPMYDIAIGNGGNNIVSDTWASSGSFLQIVGPPLNTGRWYYAAFVKAANNDWRLYVADFVTGTVTSNASSSSRTLSATGKAGFRIGGSAGSAGGSVPYAFLEGNVDEAKFETYAISFNEFVKRFTNFKGFNAIT